MRLVDEYDWWALVASVREQAKWESIAQRSRRSQRGEVGRRMRLGGHPWLPCGNTRMRRASHKGHGGHRGMRLVEHALGWAPVASVREHAYREGIAQRSRRSQRGEVGRRMRLREHRGFCGRIRGGTEAAHAERRGEEISLANLYGFNRITASLCGFAHQTDPNRK
jgi:hypothetical protein